VTAGGRGTGGGALPDWLDPLYEAAEMRAVDSWAIEEAGVASLDLMERAGVGLARATVRVAGPGPVRVVIGKGNNGGDGLVLARLLRDEGREVDVLSIAPLDELRGDPRANLERLPGDAPTPFAPGALEGSGVVVDALLGTGFSGEPREPAAGAIAAINAAQAPVVACDVPSGVDASSGEVAGEAVQAEVTATFHASKVGLHVAPGALRAGAVEVVDIGVPRGSPEPSRAGLIASRVLDSYPHRAREGSKFSSGTVVIAGGARGLTGAPAMAALAAQRTGAGYVQVAVPASAQQALSLRLLEAMTRGQPDHGEGFHTPAGVEPVLEMSERAGALVLGPGLGRSDGARAFALEVARRAKRPLLLDADGLNAHAGALELLRERRAPTVLTPHSGELGRLLERESSEVDGHRLACVRDAAQRSGAVVLLKGDDTLVATPTGRVAVSPGGTPALATAGTGDVLSGLIGALLSKGMDAFEAAALGVLAHVRAGRAAAERHGADHVIAGDVIDALPAGLRPG
jgi:NAD(P)H-hydrate epimerase